MCPHRQGVHGQWRGKPGQSWGRRATGVRGRAVGPAGYSTAVGVAEGDGERYACAGSEDSSVCQEAFSPVILPDSGGLVPHGGPALHVRAEGSSSFIQRWPCLFLPHSQLAGTAAHNPRHRWVRNQTMEVLRMLSTLLGFTPPT